MKLKLDENLPEALVVELFQRESAGAWAGCFVVLSERKLRVLSPVR